jgi:hypothetical protein
MPRKQTIGEQCGGRLWIGLKAGTRRLWKRWSSKARRRLERRDPEDAPRQDRHRGWAD